MTDQAWLYNSFKGGVHGASHLGDPNVQMVKIQIPDRDDRARALEALTLRGRVTCLPDNQFFVPEPAPEVLDALGVTYAELSRGGCDHAEKALRDSLADQAQRRATG